MSTDRPVSHLLPSLTVASVLDQPGAGGCGLLFSCGEPVPLFMDLKMVCRKCTQRHIDILLALDTQLTLYFIGKRYLVVGSRNHLDKSDASLFHYVFRICNCVLSEAMCPLDSYG